MREALTDGTPAWYAEPRERVEANISGQALASHPVFGATVEIVGIAPVGIEHLLCLRLGIEVRAV